jgi:hypothetical protein
VLVVVVFVVLVAAPVAAQTLPDEPVEIANLSGPRFGVTLLSPGVRDAIFDARRLSVKPVITQFGWQFERQFYGRTGGVTMVTEWVLLAGGLDQGMALPSASWLVGIRGRNGTEFGLGPNLTPAGFAFVFAAGKTFRTRTFNVPVNVAVVPSRTGTRVSIMTGFSLRTY